MDIVGFPFAFLYRKLIRPQQLDLEDVIPPGTEEDSWSETSTEEDSAYATETKEPKRTMHFANPNFAESFRSATADSTAEMASILRGTQFRRLESAAAKHKRSYSNNSAYADIDVDVALAPNPFAFHMVPRGDKSFISRDDSEICVHTQEGMSGLDSTMIPGYRDHVNALYLNDNLSRDDSDVGLYSMQKRIPLRHMGSALSYRVQMTERGTPDGSSMFGDDLSRCSPWPSGELPDIRKSFKERHKMIRLESVIARKHIRSNSLVEFGVVDVKSADLLGPAPRPHSSLSRVALPASKPPVAPAADGKLKSYPISFLTKVSEEDQSISGTDEDSDKEDDRRKDQSQAKGPVEPEPRETNSKSVEAAETSVEEKRKQWAAAKSSHTRSRSQSSFKIRLQLPDMEKTGFSNPFYEQDMCFSPTEASVAPPEKPKAPLTRIKSIKRSKKKHSDGSSRPSKPKLQKKDSLRLALLERYLAQSVFEIYQAT